ncbi:hypothetical protein [Aeromicrobium erythreum]|uniref:hypothetical protein n=1 Tax=Aeromicrobium erythreum TaxID=2041 RepID=UPI000A7CCC6F|nr:hypothetical protein [Aeromicrobium erythreum]
MSKTFKFCVIALASILLAVGTTVPAEAAIKTWTNSSHTRAQKCYTPPACTNYAKSITFAAKSNSQMRTITATGRVLAQTGANKYSQIYSRTITARNTTENVWRWSIPRKYGNAKLKVVVSATFKKRLYSASRSSTKYIWEGIPAVAPE